MTQLYWQVYKNLEREIQTLADTIYIDDKQQEVYSMRIADLLIRTVIEIEALSKELYLMTGGDPKMADDNMYFDTVCIKHLNDLWNLDAKIVIVVSPDIYFEEEENKVLHPLHNAHKRGKCDWKKAYQDVKHNRVKKLERGNIKHLLHGLAALYVLNLYYRDEKLIKLKESEKNSVDASFGSILFSVKIHQTQGLNATGQYFKTADFDECVYLQDYESETKLRAIESLIKVDEYINNGSQAELEKLAEEKAARGEEITTSWAQTTRFEILKKKGLLPIKDYKLSREHLDSLTGLLYNVVLNKRQY